MGQDGGEMLLRKLAMQFLTGGKVESTEKRIKILKSYIEKIVEKTKEQTEANKNFLLRKFGSIQMVGKFFARIGPAVKKRVGGYVRLVKLPQRISDGSFIARLEWVDPIIFEEKKEEKKGKDVKKEPEKTK